MPSRHDQRFEPVAGSSRISSRPSCRTSRRSAIAEQPRRPVDRQLLALLVDPDGLAVIQVESLDRPAIRDQEHRVFIDRHGRPLEPLVLVERRPRDRLAVVGAEHQQLVGLVDLEDRPIGADPEVGIDLARRRRERPVERAGIAVERDQLAAAAQTEDAALHELKAGQASRRRSCGRSPAFGRVGERVGPVGRPCRLATVSNRHCTVPCPSSRPTIWRAVAAISLSAR